MKVYYKGKIIKSMSSDSSIFHLKLKEYGFDVDYYNLYKKNWDHNECDFFIAELKKYINFEPGITDKNLIKILNKLPEEYFSPEFNHTKSIIFELVEDTNNNLYAKELQTGLLFPIMLNPKIEYYYEFDSRGDEEYNLEKTLTYTNENLSRHIYSVNIDEVASINELNQYLNKKKDNKVFDAFRKIIQFYYNENVFNKEIIIKDNDPKEIQNESTKIMEDIEYILQLIKKYDIDGYNIFKDKYDNLYTTNQNSNNYYNPDIKQFKNILSGLKLYLIILGENCKNTKDFLSKITIKYLENTINKTNHKILDINISDIDNFTDMFLKHKNDYTIFEQRNTLYLISLLYIFVIMNKFETIDDTKLEESYFSDNKKTILILIDTLIEDKIVNSTIEIDFSRQYTPKEVFDIIKELKFNEFDLEDIKKLVK